jgi:hypothetical protein
MNPIHGISDIELSGMVVILEEAHIKKTQNKLREDR